MGKYGGSATSAHPRVMELMKDFVVMSLTFNMIWNGLGYFA